MKKFNKTLIKYIVFIMVITLFAFTPGIFSKVESVSADSPAATSTPGGDTRGIKGIVLERVYQRAQRLLVRQETMLRNIDENNPKIQEFIDKRKAKGIDTSVLEGVLEAYQLTVNTNRHFHETADEVLSTHAGFDVEGKVINIEQAKTTVRSAMDALKAFHEGIEESHQAVREALKALRPISGDD